MESIPPQTSTSQLARSHATEGNVAGDLQAGRAATAGQNPDDYERWLSKDYERQPATNEAMVYLAGIRLLLAHLTQV